MSFRSLCSFLPFLALAACRATEPEESTGDARPGAPVETAAAEPTIVSLDDVTNGAAVEAGAPLGTAAPQDLGQDAERFAVRQQQRSSLSDAYVERGQDALARGDLPGALESYAQAVDVLPSNEEARAGLRRVQALLGDDYANASDFFEDAVAREIVRRSQARLAAQQALIDGDEARRGQEYDQALLRYREAEIILANHPLIARDSLDERLVRERIQSTLDEAERLQAAAEREAQLAADAARSREEEEARRQRESFLRRLYADANRAFGREDYELAQSLAKQILVNDPGNEYAIEMEELSSEARHRKAVARNNRDLHEQWIRTFQDLEGLAIPQTEAVVFDDLDRWGRVLNRGPVQPAFAGDGDTGAKTAILARLDETMIPVRFGEDGEGAPLEQVAEYLQQATGVNFVISNLVIDELDEEDTAVDLNLPDRSVKKLLDLITETSEGLRWKVEDGLVKFVTSEELIGGQVLRFYDVRDLIQPIRDFPGREINVIPSGDLELPEEDLDEREALVVTGDSLDSLIRDNVSVDSWDADPNNTLQVTESGTLVVNQTPEVHEQINRLLEDLRESTGIMVDIQARFLKVEDNFLEDIGVDFRGLGAPGLGSNQFFNDFGDASAQTELGAEIGQGTDAGAFFEDDNGNVKARIENLYDNDLGDEEILTGSGGLSFQWTYLQDLELNMILRAVSKSERVELVTAPKVLVHNTARANLTVLNQIAYIQDYDVEIAQGASIADPIVRVVEDGVILDVRPVVSADRRFITLEMRPTVAELVRPIQEFTTSLGGGTSVTIQLPQLEISRVRTSVPMPDGSTVLLGGLKIREEEKQQSGIPILNKIPIVSFVFERKGHFITNRKLLILLRAEIVIIKENEPSPNLLGPATSLR